MTLVELLRPVAATVTANTTAVSGLHTPVDATSGNLTITLPTGVNSGVPISIEKVDATTHTVAIVGTIRGVSSTLTLTGQYESLEFRSEPGGTSWRPTANHLPKAVVDAKIAAQAAADAGAYETQTHASSTYATSASVASNYEAKALSTSTKGYLEQNFRSSTQDTWFYGANDLTSQSGAPTLSNSPGGFKYSSWLLRHSASDALNGALSLPPWVATVWLDVYWTNSSTGTGAVRFRGALQSVVNGQSMITTDTLAQATVTAAAQDTLTVTRLNTTALPVAGLANLNLSRLGSDAADTLANNIAVIGVQLTVASTVPFLA